MYLYHTIIFFVPKVGYPCENSSLNTYVYMTGDTCILMMATLQDALDMNNWYGIYGYLIDVRHWYSLRTTFPTQSVPSR